MAILSSSMPPAEFQRWLDSVIDCPGFNFVDLFRRTAERQPDKPALFYRDVAVSYGELSQAIAGFARRLRRVGVAPRDRVALQLDNSHLYVVAYLGILDAGAVAVPLNTKLVASEVADLLDDCRPVLLITQDHYASMLATSGAGILQDVPRFIIDDYELEPSSPVPGYRSSTDESAAIYYTSGTTGKAKGAVHTHRSLIAGALQGPRAWEYDDPDTVSAAITPLFHIAAHTWFLPVLCGGGALVIDRYQTEAVLELIDRHRINSLAAVPSMLLMMARSPHRHRMRLETVRNVRFGAAPMPPERLGEVQSLFPNAKLIHGMGQTESCGTIVTLDSAEAFRKAGSVGRPIPGCAIRLVDDNDADVAPGAVGELLTQGPHVMKEYLNNPSESARILRGGWLHTGDMGYWDVDGYLYLVDRKKDVIIRGGENIYSTEVENALYSHPDIAQAAVIGIANDLMGEEVCAFVVPQNPERPPSDDAILDHCRKSLAPFKLPTSFIFLGTLPMTQTGKIQKHVLKERIASYR